MYCQKCRALLKLDVSLEELDPAAYDLLIASVGKSHSGLPRNISGTHSHRTLQPESEIISQESRRATAPVYKREIPGLRCDSGGYAQSRTGVKDGPGMSFVMLTESQVTPAQPGSDIRGTSAIPEYSRPHCDNLIKQEPEDSERTLENPIERTARLFEIISSRTDIDHPICIECTELLVKDLQKRLVAATKERDAYISFLRNVNLSIPSREEVKAVEQSLESTLRAESYAFGELKSLEKERFAVDEEIMDLEEQFQQLHFNEEQFWRDRTAFTLTLGDFLNERDTLNVKYDHDSRQLERLQRTNVYNDTFCIGHDGYFGTINGLRLGRLGNPPVEWTEINAAWGQTALLLATIADKLGFHFQGYKLRPMGSVSKIEKIELTQRDVDSTINQNLAVRAMPSKITSLDLFSSGDLPLNLPWLHRRFDAGMVAFLECLRQLGVYVENSPASNPTTVPMSPTGRSRQQRGSGASRPHEGEGHTHVAGLKLPYEIKRDKIGDASIKLGFNQNDETWTRACKYTLTCCKFLLAHASNVADVRSSIS